MQVALWFVVIVGVTVMCVVPAILVGGGTVDGLRRVVQNSVQFHMLLKEIFIGMAYALTAAVVAALIAANLVRRARTSRLVAAGVFGAALPGLVGSLVLGLALIQLLQTPFARFAYKTPLSLLAGLILFLWPRAIALRLLLSSTGTSAGLHLATLLRESGALAVRDRAREVAWQLRWRGEFWSVALLSYWVYFDLTLAYLLAPVTIVSAPVMLYNQMHFGKNAVLSALVFLSVLVPVLIFVAAAAVRRFIFRWF
jgi:ABC-type Fe3+ transport system permease subunit